MPHAYTEDQLVEQPAIGLFAELGGAVTGPLPNAGVSGEARDAGLLGRATKGEVVLVSRLLEALERRNPVLPPEAITTIAPGVLFEWLMDGCCNALISSKFLFEEKTTSMSRRVSKASKATVVLPADYLPLLAAIKAERFSRIGERASLAADGR